MHPQKKKKSPESDDMEIDSEDGRNSEAVAAVAPTELDGPASPTEVTDTAGSPGELADTDSEQGELPAWAQAVEGGKATVPPPPAAAAADAAAENIPAATRPVTAAAAPAPAEEPVEGKGVNAAAPHPSPAEAPSAAKAVAPLQPSTAAQIGQADVLAAPKAPVEFAKAAVPVELAHASPEAFISFEGLGDATAEVEAARQPGPQDVAEPMELDEGLPAPAADGSSTLHFAPLGEHAPARAQPPPFDVAAQTPQGSGADEAVATAAVGGKRKADALGEAGAPSSAAGDMEDVFSPLLGSQKLAKLQKVVPGRPKSGGIQIVMASKPQQAKASGEAAPGLGAFAFLAWAGPQQELRLHSDEAHALQRLQEPTGAALTAYESPLLMFHTYRLTEAYQLVSRMPLTSATFAHRLDPHWPLCYFDARGKCNDAACPYQMKTDYQLQGVTILSDLQVLARRAGVKAVMPKLPGGSLTAAQLEQLAKQLLGNMRPNRILLPGTDGARSAASTRLLQQRVELLRRKATSFETARPAYTVPAAWQAGPESGEAAEGPQRTPFASQLLGSVQNGLPPLPWSLLQSWDGYELPALPAGGPGDHLEAEESQAAPGRRQLGRYFQGGSASQAAGLPAGAAAPAAAPTAASSSPAAGPAALSEADWRQCFESLQGQEGEWLLLAVKCLGFRQPEPGKSGVALQRALKVLAKGLSMPLTHTRLWLLYLPLYTQHVLSTAPAKAVQLPGFGEKALESQQPSYRLWLAAAKVQASWAEKALLLQHGIIRIASAPLTDPTAATTGFVDVTGDQQTQPAADMRSSAALDLMLRLLQLWVAAERAELAEAWAGEMCKAVQHASHSAKVPGLEARDPWVVGPAARAALLQAVQGHPTQACVLWLTCTHMLAFGVLPDRALHRLGHVQEPFVLKWQQLPTATSNARVRQTLAAALSPGCGCLSLQEIPMVSDEASLQAALQSAWPRQALAQSIAGWQEATGAQVLLQSTAFGDLTSRLDAEGAVRVNSAL
eukprot:jgi/Astpho2/7163/Aster-x0310